MDALCTMGVSGDAKKALMQSWLLRSEDNQAGPRGRASCIEGGIFGMPAGAGQMRPNANDDASMLVMFGPQPYFACCR